MCVFCHTLLLTCMNFAVKLCKYSFVCLHWWQMVTIDFLQAFCVHGHTCWLFLSLVLTFVYGSTYCDYWYMNRKFTMCLTSVILILPLCFPKRIDFLKYIRWVNETKCKPRFFASVRNHFIVFHRTCLECYRCYCCAIDYCTLIIVVTTLNGCSAA